MSEPSEERMPREQLLHRLREVLAELETGSRRGLHIVFGWDLEQPYRSNWLVYLREGDVVDVSEMPTFCGLNPIPLSPDAPQEFLSMGIAMIKGDELFIRMNIQIRGELTPSGERLGFVEAKWGQDWKVIGKRG